MAYGNGFARGTSRTLVSNRLRVSQHRAKLRSERLPGFEPTVAPKYLDSMEKKALPRDASPIPVIPHVPFVDHYEVFGVVREEDKAEDDPDSMISEPSDEDPAQQPALINEILLSDILVALSLVEAGVRPMDHDLAGGERFIDLLQDETSWAWAAAADMYWHASASLAPRLNVLTNEQSLWLYVHAMNVATLRRARERGEQDASPAGPCETAYENAFRRAMEYALPEKAKHPDPVPLVQIRGHECDFSAMERWRYHFLHNVVPEESRRIMGLCSVPDMVRVSERFRMQKVFVRWCGGGGAVDGEEGGDEVVEEEWGREGEAEWEEEVESEIEDAETDAHAMTKKKRKKLSKQARQKRNRKLRQEAADMAKAEELTSALDNLSAAMELPFGDLDVNPPGHHAMVDTGTQTEHDADHTAVTAALTLIDLMSLSDKFSKDVEPEAAGLLEGEEGEAEVASREDLAPDSPESHTLGRLTPEGSDVLGQDMLEADLEFSQTRSLTPSPPPSTTPNHADVRRRRSGTPEEALQFSQTRSMSFSPSLPDTTGRATVRLPGSTFDCNRSLTASSGIVDTVESPAPGRAEFQDPNISEQAAIAPGESTSAASSSSQSITFDQDVPPLPTSLERTFDPRRTWSDPDQYCKFYDVPEAGLSTVSLPVEPGLTTRSRCNLSEPSDDASPISSPHDGSPVLAAQSSFDDDSQAQEQDAFGGIWFGTVPCVRPFG
ncbi:hypothetical protein CERZMDRAFT_102436 [Cercospora zeae-maydis SCOH1-5]|uniref:Uncharacterized protein n=1 Tax=Cercospora zeae-maydis SCOH1-5 TaxID=717836 RepID=A0A6A6F2F4_9PEZI|nr:hypothetical protein CERZMDRAFT_102436 [Cercospora zeae-maydis SCOH1-5]